MRQQVLGAVMMIGLAGCAVDKGPIDDQFGDLAGVDGKSDYFSAKLKLVGGIAENSSVDVAYTKTPRFRGLSFQGRQGEKVDVWVRSADGGDAVAWVLDEKFNVVAKNDDADASTVDSHVIATLPSSTSRAFYVVLRDYDLARHHFTVSMTAQYTNPVEPPAPDTSSTPQTRAFLPLFAAAGRGWATDSHLVAEASVPTAVKSALSDFRGSLDPSAHVVAWRFRAGGANAYAVIGDEIDASSRVFVSLFNASGTWVAHGHAYDWRNHPRLDWSWDMEDSTICRCGLGDGGFAGCEWVDGINRNSDVSDCD